MSRIRADRIVDRAATGAPLFPNGAVVTGVASATSFSGNVTGTTGTFTGNVSIGGTLTYEDVTNIDSVGIITARSDVSIADKIIHTGDTNTAIRFPAADTFTVETGGSEAHRVDSSQRLLVGRIASVLDNIGGTGYANLVQIQGNAAGAGLAVSNIGTGRINISRTYTPVNGDDLGYLSFGAEVGSTVERARITCAAEFTNANKRGGQLRFSTCADGNHDPTERLRITSAGAAIFKGGLAEKYENAGTTLGSQPNNPLSDGNVILFTGNESGNKTINFTGVHATLSNGETVSFTAIITPNGSGVINVVQVDGQAITVKWSGGSAPSAGSAGQDIYTFQIIKTGTGTSNYTVFGAATNYA
jgi:hypothetical protein